MRIIFLNSWYAKAGSSFYDFISEKSTNTDIFALSEVNPEMFLKLEKLLKDFKGYYSKGVFDRNVGFIYGQAVFIKKTLNSRKIGKIKIFKNVSNNNGYAVSFEIFNQKKNFYLINVHGKARPGHKLDTPARIKQSKAIINTAIRFKGPVIVGGDFNLLPETLSIRLFEKAGFRNLIKDFGIKDTRGRLNRQNYKSNEVQNFADFCFVSKEVKVENFEVPDVAISDHLPLILDFDSFLNERQN